MKIFKKLLALVLVIIFSVVLCACNRSNYDTGELKDYTITYWDWDAGKSYTLLVKKGKKYTLEKIPERFGYEFVGLYDQKDDQEDSGEEKGTQIVDENGGSILPFSGECDIELYVHYKPKQYYILLDVKGGEVEGSNVYNIAYNDIMPTLPCPTKQGYKFSGWYTDAECKTQIYDEKGNCLIRKFNKNTYSNFETLHEEIKLYAAYKKADYEVNFVTPDGTVTRTATHGEMVEEVMKPYEIMVDGKLYYIAGWIYNNQGKSTLFDGPITGNITLEAKYAPFIKFNTDGGESLQVIVCEPNKPISLPIPKKENYVFNYWTLDDIKFESSVMPQESIVLKAVWSQYTAELNLDGGTCDITTVQGGGETILPIPKKEKYLFCGWETENGKFVYDKITLNSNITLTAKWNKITLHQGSDVLTKYWNTDIKGGEEYRSEEIAISIAPALEYIIKQGKVGIKISVDMYCSAKSMGDATVKAYSSVTINEKKIEGVKAEAKGGGYALWTPQSGNYSVGTKQIVEKITLKEIVDQLTQIKIFCNYGFTTNKDNKSVKSELTFKCSLITVELYNIVEDTQTK